MKSSGWKVNIKFDFSYYATKTDLKNTTGVDTSSFAKKIDLANLKSDVDKLDVDKLENLRTNLNNLKSKVDKSNVDKLVPVRVDVRKLSNVVKNTVVKKDVYKTKIKNIEDKIPGVTNLAIKVSLNAKINKVKVEIPSITDFATNASLNTKINEVKDERPNTTN